MSLVKTGNGVMLTRYSWNNRW